MKVSIKRLDLRPGDKIKSFSSFHPKHAVGTQKNHPNEKGLLSTQNKCSN